MKLLTMSNLKMIPDIFSTGGYLDYFRGRVFGGLKYASNIVPEIIQSYAWQHPDQCNPSVRVDGTDVLDYLVNGFDAKSAEEYSVFICRKNDLIQFHFGIEVLKYIKDFWNDLPSGFISWVLKHRLYAVADTFWGDDGEIYIPCLNSLSGQPVISGHSPHSLVFDKRDFFLRG